MAEEQYYVQIRDSLDIRRALLGSSKQIIQILQRYERIKKIRIEKLEKITKMRKLNKEINLLAIKLKNEFPAVQLRVKITENNSEKNNEKENFKGDDIYKLEADLRRIEEKIGQLS